MDILLDCVYIDIEFKNISISDDMGGGRLMLSKKLSKSGVLKMLLYCIITFYPMDNCFTGWINRACLCFHRQDQSQSLHSLGGRIILASCLDGLTPSHQTVANFNHKYLRISNSSMSLVDSSIFFIGCLQPSSFLTI